MTQNKRGNMHLTNILHIKEKFDYENYLHKVLRLEKGESATIISHDSLRSALTDPILLPQHITV